MSNASTCGLVENRLQHPDHEVLRGVVVIVQQHAPHPRVAPPLVAQRLDERRLVRTGAYRTHKSLVFYRSSVHGPAPSAAVPGIGLHERNPARGMSLAPSEARCGVDIWQSIIGIPHASSWRARDTSATFEASLTRAEHRFAEEHPPDGHAVEPADQRVALPCLHRMAVAELGQPDIGLFHLRGDPGALVIAARLGAGAHDRGKRRVERHAKPARAQHLAQRARHVHLAGRRAPCADRGSTTGSGRRRQTTGRCLRRTRRAAARMTDRAPAASRPFGSRSAESTGGNGSSGERNGITESMIDE